MKTTLFLILSSLFALSVCLLPESASAQKKTETLPYQFTVKGAADTTIYLANYYGEKLFYADTARANSKGQFGFKRVKPENEGKFAVVLPGQKYFEVIIADGEDIRIESDTADFIANMKIIESENNRIMYEYVDYLSKKKKIREKLLADLEENEGKPEVTAQIKEKYNALNDEVIAHQKSIRQKHPDKLISQEILMSVDPEPPLELREDRQKAYYWYKKHYFDNVDLSDDRIVRLPIFHNKFVTYLNSTVVQDPDTLIKAVDELVARTEPGSELFKYIVHYSTYNFETSKIMGMDKVFVHMVDTYYKPEIATWMDDDKLENIRDKAKSKRYTLLGQVAPDLVLMDTTEQWISTHKDLNNKYVLLYFYDPDCGHCKKETPKLVSFFKEYEGDLAVYAVSGNNDNKWLKFIKKNEMPFHNVSIPQKAYEDADYATNLILTKKTNYHSLKYQEHFDVYSTPKLILLDKERKVRAKDIAVDQLGDILERLEEMEKRAKEG